MSYNYTYTIPETNPQPMPQELKLKTSAVRAGWICIGLGILTFWTGIGIMFFSVAMVLGIVAMCTFQIREGLAILVSAVGSVILIFLLTILLFGNVISVAAKAFEEYKTNDWMNHFTRHYFTSELGARRELLSVPQSSHL